MDKGLGGDERTFNLDLPFTFRLYEPQSNALDANANNSSANQPQVPVDNDSDPEKVIKVCLQHLCLNDILQSLKRHADLEDRSVFKKGEFVCISF